MTPGTLATCPRDGTVLPPRDVQGGIIECRSCRTVYDVAEVVVDV